MQPLIELQAKLRETNGVPKRVLPPPAKDTELAARVESLAAAPMRAALLIPRRPGAIPLRGR